MAPTKTNTSAFSPTGRLLHDDLARKLLEHARSTRPWGHLLGPTVFMAQDAASGEFIHPEYNSLPTAMPIFDSYDPDYPTLEYKLGRHFSPKHFDGRLEFAHIPKDPDKNPHEGCYGGSYNSYAKVLTDKQRKALKLKRKAERKRRR